MLLVASSSAGHSSETAVDKTEEGGDDVKSSCPLWPGLHAYYNGVYNKMQYSDMERNSKIRLSSDRSLQFDFVKLESLVIADQHAAVNTFSGLVHTARQTMRVSNTRSRWPNAQARELSKVGLMIGVKS